MKPREQKIAAIALGVLLLWMIDRWTFGPLIQSWHGTKQEIREKQTQIVSEEQILKDRKQIEQAYIQFSQRRKEKGDRGMTGLLADIEMFARQSGAKIIDIRPKEKSIDLVLESSWDALARFAYQVQQSSELLEVERTSIRRKNDQTTLLESQWIITSATKPILNSSE